jgi:hypothetical protein
VPLRTGTGFNADKDDPSISRWIEPTLGDPRVAALKSRLDT